MSSTGTPFQLPIMNATIAPPTTFLSLAPTTSSSFPAAPVSALSAKETTSEIVTSNTSAPGESLPAVADVTPAVVSDGVHDARARRSSSLSSTASAVSVKRRFLKLGPVFFGVGDGKGMGDWSEEVISE